METQSPVEKKTNNKMIIIIGIVLLVCVCAIVIGIVALTILGPATQSVSEQVLEGISYSGIASEQLRGDVLKAIASYEASQSDCSEVSLLGGQVLLSPDQTSDGSWTETWQISACGASHLYSVSFTPSPLGGTDFSATRTDQ